MTTITAQAVPQRNLAKAWRSVATFAAGAALAGGIALGVGVANDSTPATANPRATVQTQPAPVDPGCRQLRGPC